MGKLKKFLAFFLIAVIFVTFGSNNIQAKESDLIIVLDAGHGGYDSGAADNNLYEKVLTLKIAQYCKEELEQYSGVKVYLTRSSDTFVDLDKRVSIASGLKADVFVSLHINSAATPTATGAEVFYPNSNYRPSVGSQGKKLAGEIQKRLVALGLKNRGTKTLNSMINTKYPDGSVADYYAVIRGAKRAGFPGIIVEHAFISNPLDAGKYLSTNVALKKLGIADAEGIAACYGLKKSDDTTEELSKTKLTKLVGKNSSNVLLAWDKVKEANGYEIYRSNKKGGTYTKIATVKKASTVKYTDKSLKSGKTYYYKVRPYKMIGDKKLTAGFCTAQKVKLLKAPDISVKTPVASRAKISWKEMNGVVKYEIYRTTSEKGKYQKIATIQKGNFFKDTNRKSNFTYYYKVRAVSNGLKGYTYSSYSTAR